MGSEDKTYSKMADIDLDSYLRRSTCRGQQEEYLERMTRIFSAYPHFGVPREPTQVVPGVFLGTNTDADNTAWLNRNIITHVINCSSKYREYRPEKRPQALKDAGVMGYVGIDALDNDTYDMTPHFKHVVDYMKRSRLQGARVLVVSSSPSTAATMVMAYLMVVKNMFLLEAAKLLKDLRRTAICNLNFMRQLVALAEEKSLLDPKPKKIHAPTYGTPLDRHRLLSVNLPSLYLSNYKSEVYDEDSAYFARGLYCIDR